MSAERLAWWSRREALGLGLIASTSLVGFGSALYGRGGDAPGGPSYSIGTRKQLDRRVPRDGVLNLPELKAYLVRYEPTDETRAMYADSVPGYLLLLSRSPHLGCRMPFCESSQWFEDPCHGSRFNRLGEYRFGPAPHGMYRYATRLVGGVELVADTSIRVTGPPRGVDTVHQPPAGPHCVG